MEQNNTNPFRNFPFYEVDLPNIDIDEIKNDPSFIAGFQEGDKISYEYLLKRFNLIQKNRSYQIRGHIILKLKSLRRKHKSQKYFIYGLIKSCEVNYDTLFQLYDRVDI